MTGKLKLFRHNYGGGIVAIRTRSATIDVVSGKAHTGRNSLMLADTASFLQPRLHLEPNQHYVFTVWVSRDSLDVATFKSGAGAVKLGVEVQFVDAVGTVLSGAPLAEPDGPIIDGWQRIETTFTMPANAERIALRFQNGSNAAGTSLKAYFDDIRVFPVDANMESYVYDPMNYRLVALLDNSSVSVAVYVGERGVTVFVRIQRQGSCFLNHFSCVF